MKRQLLGLVVFFGLVAGLAWLSSPTAGNSGLSPLHSDSPTTEQSRHLRGVTASVERVSVDRKQMPETVSEAATGTVFTVSDQGAMPIGGARIILCDGWQRIGRTGADGTLEVQSSFMGGTSVLVRASGHVPRTVCLVGVEPRAVKIRLERAWTLTGMVVDPSGISVGEGVRVLALKPTANLTAGRLGSSLTGQGPMLVAITNMAGEFAFDELDVGLGYRLYAGGNGFCTADPFGEFIGPQASERPISLVVYPVYALHVRLREAGDSLLQLGETVQGVWWGAGVSALVEDAKIVFSGDWTEVMLGVESGPSMVPSPFDRTDYFITQVDYGDGIDVSFEPEFPGYKPAKFRLRANRVRSSVIAHSVELVPGGSGFGSLTAWFDPIDNVQSAVPPESTSGRGVYLLLNNLGSGGRDLKILLPGMESGVCKTDGIPFGHYSVQFRAPHQLFRYPKHEQVARFVTIGESQASFGIPLTDVGALEWKVLNQDGSPYVGPVSGTHVRVVGKEIGDFRFSSPPYAIPLLPVGEYTLSLCGWMRASWMRVLQ